MNKECSLCVCQTGCEGQEGSVLSIPSLSVLGGKAECGSLSCGQIREEIRTGPDCVLEII